MANFYLLAHFQYERDTALFARFRTSGEPEKAREIMASQNRFIKWWNNAANAKAISQVMAKGKPADYMDKLTRVHEKYREFQQVRGYV